MPLESTTVSSKGQVTIPVRIRRRLGLKPGDRIEFVVKAGMTTIQPVRGEENPFAEFVGALGRRPNGTAVSRVRRMRDEED